MYVAIGKYTFPLFVFLCAILLYEFLKFVVIRLLYSADEVFFSLRLSFLFIHSYFPCLFYATVLELVDGLLLLAHARESE